MTSFVETAGVTEAKLEPMLNLDRRLGSSSEAKDSGGKDARELPQTKLSCCKAAPDRLFDYLLYLGPHSSGLTRRRDPNLRHNSHTILPITRLSLETCSKKDYSDLPAGCEPVLGLDRKPVNVGSLLSRKQTVLCISRALCEPDATNGALLPIRDILRVTRYENAPPNYKPIEGNIPLCCSRVSPHEPLIDIVIIKSGEKCPADFVELKEPLNPGAVVGNLFLCYCRQTKDGKKEAYEPELLSCYPCTQHADFKLDFEAVSLLCFPRGITLTTEPSLPRFFTFVLTEADGSEVYGASLIFYEPYGEEEQEQQQIRFAGKAMCVLSHHPFYEEFRKFVGQLFQIAVSPNTLPLEFWISHFYWTVSVPEPAQRVTYLMAHSKLVFHRPLALGLPMLESLTPLFTFLKIDDIITIFEHLLGESKIVFYSNSYQGLTIVMEALRGLLFPFKWQCLFVPILPSSLSYTLRAPMPFLIGMHRSCLQEVRVSEEVLLVDLDRGSLRQPTGAAMTPLPLVLRNYLRSQLSDFAHLYRDGDNSSLDESLFTSSNEGITQEDCLEIRVVFMRVLVVLLGDYRKSLRLKGISSDAMVELTEFFDCDGFVQRQLHPDFQAFATHLAQSQMFSDFIMHRVLPPSFDADLTRHWQLLFFDYCIALFHSADVTVRAQTEPIEETKSEAKSRQQQILKRAKETVKAVQGKWGNSSLEFRLEAGKFSPANLSLLATPIVQDAVILQPDLPGLPRCSYTKFPDLNPELFQKFDAEFAKCRAGDKQPLAQQRVPQVQAATMSHCLGMCTLLLSLMAELPRAAFVLSMGDTTKARVLASVCDVYEMWFLLRINHYHGSTKAEAGVTLLLLLTQAYAMVRVTAVPLTETIVSMLCGFCVSHGLEEFCHIIFHLACHTISSPSTEFFVAVSQQLYGKPPLRDPPVTCVFTLPDCMETRAPCSSCGYDLPGVDVLGTLLALHCPMCSEPVTPELVVWSTRQSSFSVPFKPAAIKRLLLDNPDGQPGEVLDRARASPEIFWNLFWLFATRGSPSFGLAELPFLFLFNGLPPDSTFSYVFHAPLWGPWRLIRQEGFGDVESALRDREQVHFWETRGAFNEVDLEALKRTRPWSVAVIQDAAAVRPRQLYGVKFLTGAARRILEYRVQATAKGDTQSPPGTPFSSFSTDAVLMPTPLLELTRDNSAFSLSTFLTNSNSSPKHKSHGSFSSFTRSAMEDSSLRDRSDPSSRDRSDIREPSSRELRRPSESTTRASSSKSANNTNNETNHSPSTVEVSRRGSTVKSDHGSMLSQLGSLLHELVSVRDANSEAKSDPVLQYLTFVRTFQDALDAIKLELETPTTEGCVMSLPLTADSYLSKMQGPQTSALLQVFLVSPSLGDSREMLSRFCADSPTLLTAIRFCNEQGLQLYPEQPPRPQLARAELSFVPSFYLSLCTECELRTLKMLLQQRDASFLALCQSFVTTGSLSAMECAEMCIAELEFQEEYSKLVTTSALTAKDGDLLDDLFTSHAQPLFDKFLRENAPEGTGLRLPAELVASIWDHLEMQQVFPGGAEVHRCYEFSVFEPATNAAKLWLRAHVLASFLKEAEEPGQRGGLRVRGGDIKGNSDTPRLRSALSAVVLTEPPLPPRPPRPPPR